MADADLRKLERQACLGDEHARRRLFFMRKSLGICVDCGVARARRRQWSDIWDPISCMPCQLARIKERGDKWQRRIELERKESRTTEEDQELELLQAEHDKEKRLFAEMDEKLGLTKKVFKAVVRNKAQRSV